MHLPYTDNYPQALSAASRSLAWLLTAVIWARPLTKRSATLALTAAVWLAALFPNIPAFTEFFHWVDNPNATQLLGAMSLHQHAATIVTLAVLLTEPLWFGAVAVLGQMLLLAVSLYLRESEFELTFAYLAWFGVIIGVHAARFVSRESEPMPRKLTVFWQDLVIFLGSVALAAFIADSVFARAIYNGDEVANSFQADVFAHFRAYGVPKPCASMFQNFWVFTHDGRLFSQYTPGWPLFMAVFQRFDAIWLAGPVMTGIAAVGIARLSRRLVRGVGGPLLGALALKIAGPLGATLAVLGPSFLLNGASRFSHTMVCACFAWSVESLCVLADRPGTRSASWGYGFLLGASTSLSLATRPSDGGMLGIGVFLYFVWVLVRRRIGWREVAATSVGFLLFGGLTLVILRLQLGHWFATGYSIAESIHPGAALELSLPKPNEVKYGIPLATGSYCWWPAAPALGLGGVVQAMKGRERRLSIILLVSTAALLVFYSLVTFGRGGDDGHGPRYVLPSVVLWASGSAALLAPVLARFFNTLKWRYIPFRRRLRAAVPALTAIIAIGWGGCRIAERMYPVAKAETLGSTGPLRAARDQNLRQAIVVIVPGAVPTHEQNVAQNPPMNDNPDALFLIRNNAADEACARKAFPDRTWYRAGMDTTLPPY